MPQCAGLGAFHKLNFHNLKAIILPVLRDILPNSISHTGAFTDRYQPTVNAINNGSAMRFNLLQVHAQ
ncbi:hypothetical protein D3C86_1612560 [compost metagenome]